MRKCFYVSVLLISLLCGQTLYASDQLRDVRLRCAIYTLLSERIDIARFCYVRLPLLMFINPYRPDDANFTAMSMSPVGAQNMEVMVNNGSRKYRACKRRLDSVGSRHADSIVVSISVTSDRMIHSEMGVHRPFEVEYSLYDDGAQLRVLDSKGRSVVTIVESGDSLLCIRKTVYQTDTLLLTGDASGARVIARRGVSRVHDALSDPVRSVPYKKFVFVGYGTDEPVWTKDYEHSLIVEGDWTTRTISEDGCVCRWVRNGPREWRVDFAFRPVSYATAWIRWH